MGKVLSPWCKQAKIAMIELDMTVVELAGKIGKSREYTSAVVNGRIYAEPVVKAISDVLNIPETACSLKGNYSITGKAGDEHGKRPNER